MGFSPDQARAMGLVCDASGQWSQPKRNASLPAVGSGEKVGLGPGVDEESDLHDEIAAYCRARVWPYVHSRMDRRTTQAPGVSDFIIALPGAATVWVECKRRGAKPTPEQLTWAAGLRRVDHVVGVARCMAEFLALIEEGQRRAQLPRAHGIEGGGNS